jgi:transposase InsO family protein
VTISLRSRVSELFSQSRSAAGSRSLLSLMRDDGEQLGRFKVRSLMRELDLVSKQPGSHAYKRATVERLDIPNILNREFDVPAPNQVWCGDITYIWAQGKWHYLAVVLDLCARRIVGWALSEKPDAELVIKALDMTYEQRGRPQGLLFHSDLRLFLKKHIGGGKRLVMPFYSAERKAALLKMMLPPLSLSAAEVARREACSDMSLHYWRKQAAARGTHCPTPSNRPKIG